MNLLTNYYWKKMPNLKHKKRLKKRDMTINKLKKEIFEKDKELARLKKI